MLSNKRSPTAAGPRDDAGPADAELQSYLSGSSQAPIPTYFIGSYGAGSTTAMQSFASAVGSNLHYLGRAGLKTLAGLNVAFLDGTFDQSVYQSKQQAVESGTGCTHYTQVDPSRIGVCLVFSERYASKYCCFNKKH